MDDVDRWWDVDDELLRCLTEHGPMTPDELGKRLGMSETAAVSVVAHLAREGKARICLVATA